MVARNGTGPRLKPKGGPGPIGDLSGWPVWIKFGSGFGSGFGSSFRSILDQRPALVALVDPPALVARFDDVAMVRQSVEGRGCHFGIGEHARPFAEGKVGCQQDE